LIWGKSPKIVLFSEQEEEERSVCYPTPLRLEPVLLLRKLADEQGTIGNKWWVLSKDRAEYRNGRWDYA